MNRPFIKLIIIALTFVMMPLFSLAETYRVKINGSDSGDGSDWGANAMSNKKFAQALLTAQPGDVFQLSAGKFFPYYDAAGNVPANARLKTFLIRTGVNIHGSYNPDTGNADMNYTLSVLSGDIGTLGAITDNSYNVVTIAKGANDVSLEMITISGGYGNGGGNYSRGAGIFVGENAGTTKFINLSYVNITKNSSNGHGSGIFVDNNAIVNFSKSFVSHNTRIAGADTWGGGISVWNNAKVNTTSTEVFNNTALYGGGVHVTQATYTSYGSTYSNNSAGTHGGGIDGYLRSSISLNDDKVLNNNSGYGGGIHNEAGTSMQITSVDVKGNTATYEGGGFLNREDCTVTLTDCVFDDNKASVKGGGIDNKGQMTINGSRIINNSANGATAWGGGISQSGGKLVVRGSEVSGNTAKHGGGVHLEAGNSIISNTTISGNTALTEGGGIDSYAGSHNLIYNTITNNTAPVNKGSGIFVVSRPGLQNSLISGNANNDDVRGVLNNSGTNSADNNIIGSHFYRAGNSASQGIDVNFSASAHLDVLAFNRGGVTYTHKLKWVTNSAENPAVGRAAKLDGSADPTYLKDQTNKVRGNKPSLGAYEEDLFNAYDDVAFTQTNTPITIEIGGNDAIPDNCSPAYTLQPGMSPVPLYGQFSTLSGTMITYTPNSGASGTDTMYYRLTCGALTDVARIIVTVGGKDRPGNIKDEEICMDDMLPIAFSAKEKYSNKVSRLDGFSMPVVGDLDGDGKPEIIALGLRDNSDGSDLQGFARYVIVYNGQTGAEMLKFDLRNPLIGSTNEGFKLRYETRHNSPSKFALADLDGQKGAELVVTETASGRVYALKPVYANGVLTNFTKLWEVITNHKSPIPVGALANFSSPMPYISDLNGDGIPEVIVYNKIYNGKTGDLILQLETLNRFARPINQANVNTYTSNQNPNGGGYAYVGRRPGTLVADDAIPAMAIIDIDNDGIMEIVAGSKVYKPNIVPGSTSTSVNSFTIIHGPGSVSYPRANGVAGNNTFYLSDGFTAVADIDGDGHLDIIVQTTTSDGYDQSYAPLIYVWDPRYPGVVKAVVAFRGQSYLGTMSMPFIGDINGRKDDYTGTKTLPEICYNAGILHTNMVYGSPISYHPLSSADLTANARFNGTALIGPGVNQIFGHIVGFTFHANPDGSTPVHERLKMSWAMEHGDESSCTGITMFDFDADGVKELVYRDETSLRVISPARKTYIPKNEPVNALTGAIRFKKENFYSFTGHEAPVIADVNGDASADIVTFANVTSKLSSYGNLFVFEADGESWAPARPVWNQGIYYPLQINDDLTVPRRPISTLTEFTSQRPGQPIADIIQPYNGNWIQQPVVRTGNYTPVIFTPDLSIEAMKIIATKSSPDSMVLRLTMENRGKSSANSNTPITFYHTSVTPGNKIKTLPLGFDIFPGETVNLTYTIPGKLTGSIVHVRLVDDGTSFLAAGFQDCDPANNTAYTVMVKANDDRYSLVSSNLSKFDVRLNDSAFCKILPEIIHDPKHGVAAITADSLISYTSLGDFEGTDTLRYVIKCEYGDITATDTAYVHFIVAKKPDNISDADCVLDVVGTDWNINKTNIQVGAKVLHAYTAPVAGDLDNNKIPDVVALGYVDDINAKDIYIYFDRNRANPKKITTPNIFSRNIGGVAIARVKIGADTTSLIVVHGTDQYLYAYNANGATNQAPVWKSSTTTGTVQYTAIAFADFNNDGTPEVYAGKKIYNAATGKELLAAPGNSGISSTHSMAAVANVYGDAKLEYIAGNQVYEVNIVNKNDNTGGQNTMTLVKKLTGASYTDGVTVVADFNQDGKLDVAVRVISNPSRLYIWDVEKEKIIAETTYTNSGNWNSIPFIGDIDGNGDLEIVVVTASRLNVFDYNGTTTLAAREAIVIQDDSGCTGITLFDFNQDGIAELVYRDEKNLYIYNVVGSTLVAQETIPCGSLTVFEYPIVLDVDADGSAEIVVIGGDEKDRSGYLHILKSLNPGTWGPARKVWNQYAYNVVNVNNDLSIPQYQLNPATFFAGHDKILGVDDIQPYNNFLQQATMLNKNGEPLWLGANATITDPAPTTVYHSVGDSLTVTVNVKNEGDAALQAPFYLSAYANSIAAANLMAVDSLNSSIAVGVTETVTITIRNVKSHMPISDLVISLNDKGKGSNFQAECDYNNNSYTRPFSSLLLANRDVVHLFKNDEIDVKVLANDSLASCKAGVLTGFGTIPSIGLNNGTLTVNNADSTFTYTPNTDYIGVDSVLYYIKCGVDSSAAVVYFNVHNKPDNIIDSVDCVMPLKPFDFKIKQKWKSDNDLAHRMSSTLVGDLDGDGTAEIAVYGDNQLTINIFSGNSKTLKAQIAIPSVDQYQGWRPAIVALMVDADRNGLGEIIVARSDFKIISYEANTTGGVFTMKEKWTASQNYVSPTNHRLPHPNIADLNGDGVPELIVNNYVYNAATGAFLGETEAVATANIGRIPLQHDNKTTNFQTIADIDSDGILEIIAGGKVYKPHFNATKTAVTFTKLFENTTIGDGYTSVADVDLDGNLDVVVGKASSATTTHLYIWSPLTGTMIDDFQIAAAGGYNGVSAPFIGDIDGYMDAVTNKKYPEICVNSVYKVFAYKYNSTTGKYSTKWTLTTSDQSGATGIVLFDFNNDGVNELVYRDQTHLRILNGVADNVAPVLADAGAIFACVSSTSLEYPSIADVDGDGSANICVTCNPYLTVYESGSTPWAPTRKVWNQVNYEPLLINDDLTTTRFPIPKHMGFDGKHPYNGAMIQVPMVDTTFVPILIAADPKAVSMTINAVNSTTLRVSLEITNEGTTNTNVNLPVTLYHTDTVAANKIDTKPIGVQIAPGDTASIYWDVVGTYNKFKARIQDDGTKYPAAGSYLDCDYSNNLDSVNVLLAVNDTLMLNSNGGAVTLDILVNDFLGACGRDNLTTFDIIPNSGLKNGTLVINADNTVTYTFTSGSSGVDSLSYYVKCGADSSAAKVYLLVNKPLSLTYSACPGAFINLGFEFIPGVQYMWYANQVGPPHIGIMSPTNPVYKDGPSDRGTWWVEPYWKGVRFPRYRIDLLPADNCGEINPMDCAVDGTVIWKEDFDKYDNGLSSSSLKYSQVPLIAGMTTYNFMNTQGTFPTTGMYAPGNYAIVKDALDPNRTDSWLRLFRDDHTYPDDKAKGRFFVANGRKAKDQLYKQEIDGLCDNVSSLYFSFWARGYHAELKWTIYSSDTDEVLSVLSLPAMPDLSHSPTELEWLHYGFKFDIPAGVSSIYFDIYNNCALATGNDFALDDIEVRLCAPPVIIANPIKSDTTICSGTEFIFEGNYEEGIPVVFGNDLVYRWEYSQTGDINDVTAWSAVAGTQGTSSDGKVTNTQSKYTIASVSKSDEGYYRLVVGNASTIGRYVCRAMSKVVKLGIHNFQQMPDVRIQACPSSGIINLSSYLDTTGIQSVTWTGSASMPPVSALGILDASNFQAPSTYKYNYKVETLGGCFVAEGVLYASAIKDRTINLPPDTVVVCYKNAEALQLNRILGIEAGAKIEAEQIVINADYVKQAVPPAIYYGATIFNGAAVYENAALTGATYDYTGPLTTGVAKKITFKYTPPLGNCLDGKVYRFVIILTDELVP